MVKVRDFNPLTLYDDLAATRLFTKIAGSYSYKEQLLLKKSLSLLQELGITTFTKYGVRCYSQGLTIAEILYDLHLEYDVIISGLLYDLWNALPTKIRLNQRYYRLITHLKNIDHFITSKISISYHQTLPLDPQNNYLCQKILTIVPDIRLIFVKLAQHICDLRVNLQNNNHIISKKLVALSALVYIPLANYLAVNKLKWEIEDLTFRLKEPKIYKDIAKLIAEKFLERTDYLEKVKQKLLTVLRQKSINATVYARPKHIYSIYLKMKHKNLNYHQIYDLKGLRIIVASKKNCYLVLELVHNLWKFIPEKFDDYILTPKANGYKSLHTGVIIEDGKIIEIQIRTTKMHEYAELGLAAHWRYKCMRVENKFLGV